MRYEDVSEEVVELFNTVRKNDFPELVNAHFKLIYSTKKSKSAGRYIVARIRKLNELARFFTSDVETGDDGFDYCIEIDKNIWEKLDPADRYRIIRHELYHCEVNFDKKIPYGLRGHEVETFYDEIEAEQHKNGDPKWNERIGYIAESVYDPDSNE